VKCKGWLVVLALLMAAGSARGGKEKDAGQIVDSGSFGVFINGQRIATETFSVQQQASGNRVTSEMKEASGANQNSEMQITAGGELIHYEWHELSPGKGQLVLVPADQFLKESITPSPTEKTAEQPFLLPASTAVLDNNFFVHREILAWRYLSANCKTEAGKLQCALSPSQFGVIVPQDRLSMRATLELKGKEKIQVRGAERELLRVNLKAEGTDWAMWLDDQFKLVRIFIASDNTEVVRD